MSEQISTELLQVMNDIADNEATIAKIDASIFLRESEQMINEKVAYLYNMITIEAKNCNQRQDSCFEDINLIITHYKQQLNMVYDEFYCQYVNIQNELQEASNNKRIAMINYQKLINDLEKNPSKTSAQKEYIKKKNEDYNKIITMCKNEFEKLRDEFEKMITEEFTITSKSLQLISEQNVFQRFFGKIASLFNGSKKFAEILKEYNKTINNINSYDVIGKIRNGTVDFVADIIELKGIDENGLEENARIGGRNGRKCK